MAIHVRVKCKWIYRHLKSKYKCPFSSNLLLAIIKQFTIQRYHNDNLQSYTSTCQGIKDISSTFMEINEDKIVLLIFEGFQYTKVICIGNQEIFCKYLWIKKKSSEQQIPINVIVRQLHAISFNVNYQHVIHDWLCTLRPLSSFHHVFTRIDNKEYVISVHIWRRQKFCIPCIMVCKVAFVTVSLLFSRFHFMTMLKYVMHEVVYLRYRQKNSKMTEI